MEQTVLVLTKPNRDRIGVLNEAYNVVYSDRFNEVSELTFSYPKYVITGGRRVKNDYYDLLTGMKQLFVPDLGYFMVAKCAEEIDGVNLIKSVTCYSLEFELSKKKLNLLSGTYKFYDPIDLPNSIIGKALEPAPGWSVGEIDSDLWNIYRTFDINDTNVYNFLLSDVEEAFQCIFFFDTVNKTVSAKTFANVIKETDIFFSFHNLMTNAKVDENIDELVTALKVYGSGDLSIHSVNPTGTATIYDFSYYKNEDWMSPGLVDAVTLWEDKYEQAKVSYGDLLTEIKTKNTNRIRLEGQLTDLKGELSTLETIMKTRVEIGADTTDIKDSMNSKQLEINAKQAEIDAVTAEVNALLDEMSDINADIAFENNFTESQLLELSPFIIENSYQNESFITTTQMTQVEKQVMAENLYNIGLETLDRLAQPRYTVSIDSVNYMYLKEYYKFASQTELGCSITIELEDSRRVELLLLEIQTSMDDPSNFTLTFGNRYRITSEELTFAELFGQVNTLGNTISWDSVSWNEASAYIEDTVSKFIDSALDCSKNAVINASNQEILIDRNGLRGRKATTNGFDPKQVWLTSNVLAFTKDNWDTVSTALGEIVMPDGSSAYGIVGDAIVGKLLVGNQLTIANESNTFTVDGSGASMVNGRFDMMLANGTGRIILDPAEGIKIQGLGTDEALEDKLLLGSDGNIEIKGSIKAGSTVSGATISGGSITIGNNAFKVNEDGSLSVGDNFRISAAGELTATSGRFEGTIKADKIDGEIVSSKIASTLNGKDLVGGSLNIGNGAFTVDSNGNVTITNGSISWGAVTGTSAIDNRITAAQNMANTAASAASSASVAASNAESKADNAADAVSDLANGYYSGTFIDNKTIRSPNIYGGTLSSRSYGNSGYGVSITGNRVNFYDGVIASEMGFIEYYDGASQTGNNSSGGIRIRTVDGSGYRAIKLEASGSIALAGNEIWFYTDSYSGGKSLSSIISDGGAVFG